MNERLSNPPNLRKLLAGLVVGSLLGTGAAASFHELGEDQGYSVGYEQGVQWGIEQGIKQQKSVEMLRESAEVDARTMTARLINGDPVRATIFNGQLYFGDKQANTIQQPIFFNKPDANGTLFIGYQSPDKDGNPAIAVLEYDPQSGMHFFSEDYATRDVSLIAPPKGGGDVYVHGMVDGQVITPGIFVS